MKASDYVAAYLERRGVTHVFELVGGMITFLLDSIHQRKSIVLVSMHHEQGAGFAAEGFSRVGGVPGVAMATSGPGATNLLTAIGSCYFDSTAAVFITGQVNRHEQKGNRAVRQLGFQETDIVSMARPVTKAAWLVEDPAALPRLLEEAFALACAGRPGPVLLDLPMDVQRADITDLSRLQPPECCSATAGAPGDAAAEEFWRDFCAQLAQSTRPLILAGGGIRSGQVADEFRRFVARLGVPVVHSLMAVDVLTSDDPFRIGLIGSYGNRWANSALGQCDLLLVLGSRLDVRQTGADTAGFKAGRQIFHVDCDPAELNNRVTGCSTLTSDLRRFFAFAATRRAAPADLTPWRSHLADLRARWPDTAEFNASSGINPNAFMHSLSDAASASAAFVVDVGQHQMWAAQSVLLRPQQRFLTSGGMGAMGFALPAAIGATFAAPDAPTVVIAGDGGFQLNLQELQTVVRHQLPLKIIVINNRCHGMVRQFQESYFKGRYQSTLWGYSAPSFRAVAQAYGIPAESIAEPGEIEAALARCCENPRTPYLLEVFVATETNAYPKMAFGRPITEMEPLAKPLEMEGT